MDIGFIKCVTKWLKNNKNCPCCRQNMPSSPISTTLAQNKKKNAINDFREQFHCCSTPKSRSNSLVDNQVPHLDLPLSYSQIVTKNL